MGVYDAGGELFVEQWVDLRRLPLVMDDVAEQAERIVAHATTWVADRSGFEPSPVCLLRPLAGAMDVIAAAFEALGEEFAESWAGVRAGVVLAERELAASEERAVEASAAIARALIGVA
ncbi:MAG TPA: hypothetical protein VMF51_18605 [Nocardioides sp.]|uniref:hypothetical protein n=1 Tax=Nocardioides sp. TaxID=35761 RepID=UPI002CA9B62F|nr:hypothetical protein [Nocardioides sp.]HTW17148.1 hypothetical protein [Nocardioides sp.]